MTCIDAILRKIKENPYIYLGELSLTKLKAFLDGYIIREFEINGIGSVDIFAGFQKYVEKKFSVKTTDNWSTVISNQFADKNEAFHAFFELMDEYRTK